MLNLVVEHLFIGLLFVFLELLEILFYFNPSFLDLNFIELIFAGQSSTGWQLLRIQLLRQNVLVSHLSIFEAVLFGQCISLGLGLLGIFS